MTSPKHPRTLLLFCYGSNGPDQLRERLGHSVVTGAAFLEGYKRVFRGLSRRWGGGVASLVKRPGAVTYGLVAWVNEADLEALDRFEGAPTIYARKTFTVTAAGKKSKAVAYVRVDKAGFHPPTRAYLEACAKTVGGYWSGRSGKVKPEDFDVE